MNIIRIICLLVFFCLLNTAQRLSAQCNLSLFAQVEAVTCSGGENGSIDLTVNGGTAPYTYQWSNGLEEEDLFGLSAGTYWVIVTDDAGCTASLTRAVTEFPPLSVTVQSYNIGCWDPATEISAQAAGGTAPYLYIWSNGATGAMIYVDTEAEYTVTVIDGNSCTATGSGYVAVDTIPPGADAGPDQALNCITPTVTLGGPGTEPGPNVAYHWSGPGITQGPGGNGNDLNPVVNQPGVYTLLVFSFNNACEKTDVVIVTGAPAPVADAGPDTGIPCGGSTVQLDGSGSTTGPTYSYLWTTTDGNIVAGATTLTPTVDQPGIYRLEVTDNAGACTTTDAVRVFPGPA
ncbi:MAG: PKD domain-containing protein, partial [Saprospiraceae bacterium]|nr:PKD domain-containing protein [Saprospiraceae bacterium]